MVSVLSCAMGIIYLFTPGIMPYHETFIGKRHDDLEPNTGYLLLALLRMVGTCMLCNGLAIIFFSRSLFKHHEQKLLLGIFLVMVPPLSVTFYFSLNIGLHTPWWFALLILLMQLAALAISYSHIRRERNH